MLDLTLWAPVDCICSTFCSDPDGLHVKGLTCAADANAPTKDGTLSVILNSAPVMSTKWVTDTTRYPGEFLTVQTPWL